MAVPFLVPGYITGVILYRFSRDLILEEVDRSAPSRTSAGRTQRANDGIRDSCREPVPVCYLHTG